MVVTIVGAGLTGSMLAILLSQHGRDIVLIEKRARHAGNKLEDSKENGRLLNPNKRSINLALSFRGIEALKEAGLFEKISPLLVPMEGRCVHPLGAPMNVQPYAQDKQAIYSISRAVMNDFLLDRLASLKNVSMRFESTVERISPDGHLFVVEQGKRQEIVADLIVGADGAFSSVRDSLMKCSRIDVDHQFLPVGYKEFFIPASSSGSSALPYRNNLHIWPRHELGMLVALPNSDGSFACTLFIPWDGPQGLVVLDEAPDQDVLDYFRELFPDVFDLIPDLIEQFRSSPSSPLVTIKTNPLTRGRVVLLGDAAHAISPFYGQGMNAGFEDALLFQELWIENGGDIPRILKSFNDQRQPAGIALADLSSNNFREMSSLTAQRLFLWKKRVEFVLSRFFPNLWIPLYTMVSFTRMPYDKVQQRARIQDAFLYTFVALVFTLILFSSIALVRL